jgi:hypothetical protein
MKIMFFYVKCTTVENESLRKIQIVKVIGNSVLRFDMPGQDPMVLRQMKQHGQHCRIFIRRAPPLNILSKQSFRFDYFAHIPGQCVFCNLKDFISNPDGAGSNLNGAGSNPDRGSSNSNGASTSRSVHNEAATALKDVSTSTK